MRDLKSSVSTKRKLLSGPVKEILVAENISIENKVDTLQQDNGKDILSAS